MHPTINVHLDGDGIWPELATNENVIDAGAHIEMARLKEGTLEGNPTVTLRIDIPGDRVVLVQTTVKLLKGAVQGLESAQ